MFISSLIVRALIAEVERRGIESVTLVNAAQLTPDQLARPFHGVRPRAFVQTVARAIELTDEPALGLVMGLEAPESLSHPLGMLLLSSASLGDAFDVLERHHTLLQSALAFRLVRGELLSRFGYTSAASDHAVARFVAEWTLGLALRIGRHFAPGHAPCEVWVQHDAPAYAARYQFAAPVYFGQHSNAILFASELLACARPRDALRDSLRAFAEGVRRDSEQHSLSARVGAALRSEVDLVKPDLERIARAWGMSRRMLGLKLKREGRALSELVEEARRSRALEALARTNTTISQLATQLGFSEPSAFHRAFKRWTGRTPSEFRAG